MKESKLYTGKTKQRSIVIITASLNGKQYYKRILKNYLSIAGLRIAIDGTIQDFHGFDIDIKMLKTV
jgi:hypothetical protein